MSNRSRGGGRGSGGRGSGGRRPAQSSPDQPTPIPAQRGGRSGRGGFSSSAAAAAAAATPVSSSSATVSGVGSLSSRAAATTLSHDVEQRLTLQAPSSSQSPQQPPASSKAVRFPARPGPGTVGTRCVVRANHFLVQLQDKDLRHYDVAITPEVISRGVNRAVIRQLVLEHRKTHLGNLQPAYDGRKSLYTAGALPFSSKEFVIKLVDNDGDSSKRKERSFKVAIKLAARADMHHLQQFLCGRQIDSPQDTIQALDVVLRESPSENCTVVGRSFFSVNFGQRGDIGDGLECWKGFYQSLRPTQMGLSLNIDVSATSFYEPINVVEFVFKYLNIRDSSRPLSDTDRVKLKKALRGVKVEVTHRKDKRRYKVSGVTPQLTNQLRFPDEKGTMKSVVQYFQEKYGVRLQYVSWPSLQAGSDSRPVYLPMEVCEIVAGQRYTKKLNEKQVTALLRAACQRPFERERNIKQIVEHNKYKTDKFAKEFGIGVDDKLTCIEDARVLPPPVLKYHDTGREVRVSPRVGQWNMINAKMVNGARVDHWVCLNFSSRVSPDAAFYFFKELVGMCANKGMVFNQNPLLPMRNARASNIEQILEEVSKQSASKLASLGIKAQLQLVIIILPDFSGTYGTIKRLCETKLGIISQCCQPRHAMKVNRQYLENLALKINVKAGGRNTVLLDALMKRIPLVSDAPTIIFGADVTHPPPGEDSSPSIAAVVASMDWPEVTKYRGLVSAQPHRMELIQDLYKVVQDPQRGAVNSGMIREMLIAFRRSTGFKPHRIIFYRDGVSEGQFSQVLLYELDAIRKACASLEEGYLPPVTFVVVQKRHHTRLFPVDHNNKNLTDRSGNILPGTVVDTKICHPSEFDFYLCSHSGIQGTSRPTHYHILWDENKFTSDALQMLTNNLCYTYARCTRSVSIVPPAYYAHLAAFRARYYIEGDTSDGGSAGVGSSRGAGGSAEPRLLPQIIDSVKEVMFYC